MDEVVQQLSIPSVTLELDSLVHKTKCKKKKKTKKKRYFKYPKLN